MEQDWGTNTQKCVRLLVKGVVQGVGFRPFVYSLARDLNLTGYVKNTDDGVIIMLQGGRAHQFIDMLSKNPPPLADIKSVEIVPIDKRDETFDEFTIHDSEGGVGFTVGFAKNWDRSGDSTRSLMDDNRTGRYDPKFKPKGDNILGSGRQE